MQWRGHFWNLALVNDLDEGFRALQKTLYCYMTWIWSHHSKICTVFLWALQLLWPKPKLAYGHSINGKVYYNILLLFKATSTPNHSYLVWWSKASEDTYKSCLQPDLDRLQHRFIGLFNAFSQQNKMAVIWGIDILIYTIMLLLVTLWLPHFDSIKNVSLQMWFNLKT